MKLPLSKVLGLVIGAVLVIGTVITIFFVDWTVPEPDVPKPVRPLKTFVVDAAYTASGGQYPGKVAANQTVDLAFQVAGPLIEMPVKNGDEVQVGDIIAKIDPSDFINERNAAKAVFTDKKQKYDSIRRSFENDAASKNEMIKAKAGFEAAEAQLAIKQKAVDDTVLRAPFAGVIARSFAENFQNVQAKEPIIRLQDVSEVEIKVSVPEQRVAQTKENKGKFRFVARFEYLPGREFEVLLKEFATEADPVTQTYEATLVMPAPKDVNILPGMTATIHAFLKEKIVNDEADSYLLPLAIVPVDGLGKYYVWKLKDKSDGTWAVNRVDVEVAPMIGDDILVTKGLKPGDRIAAAGVHLLEEDQVVKLLANASGKGDQ